MQPQITLPEKQSSTILDRLHYLREILKMNQSTFGRKIGVDASFISRIMSGKLAISQSFINRVVVNLGVSKEWLETGRDVPFAKSQHAVTIPETINGTIPRDTTSYDKGALIYDIDVTAGCQELSMMFTQDRVIGRVELPQLNPQHYLVRVSGESMMPRIKNGAYIAIRPISDTSVIFWGQIYVVVLDDYRMVKQIRKHPTDKSMVLLHSENPDFEDIEIRQSQIRALYLVESIINYDLLA